MSGIHIERLVKEIAELRRQNIKLEMKNQKLELENNVYKNKYVIKRGSDSKLDFTINTKRMCCYQKKIKEVLQSVNGDLRKVHMNFNRVEIGQSSEQSEFSVEFTSDTNKQANTVELCTLAKDEALLSDKKYALLRKRLNLKTLKSLYSVKKYRSEFNEKLENEDNIIEVESGYYIKPVALIKERILCFLNNSNVSNDNCIQIKISIDGTKLCRNVNVINLVFTIINDKNTACSNKGANRIGIFETSEEYEELEKFLPEIWNEIKQLKSIFYDKKNKTLHTGILDNESNFKKYDIEYFFCSDWKVTAVVLGLMPANSNWPCWYCTIHKNILKYRGIIILF